MVTRRSLMLTAASATALALTLSACGNDAGSGSDEAPAASADADRDISLDFVWWGDATRGDLYEEALAVFHEQHPNITVRQQFQSWDDYWTARSTEVAGSSLPDVVALDPSHALQWGERGQLLDLTGQIGVNLDTSGIDESILAGTASDGAQYAIPIGTNALSLLYNADLLDELGVEAPVDGYTWDDYDTFVSQVSEAGAGRDPQVYGTTDYTLNLQMFTMWLIQQDIAPYTDGEVTFTEDQVRTWLERGEPLRADGAFTPIQTTTQLQAPAFNVGVDAATINWASALGPAINDLDSENVGIMLPPSGANGPAMTFGISMAFGIGTGSDEPDAAALFIDFLTNAPEVGEIFGTTRGVPASESQRDGVVVEDGSVDAQVLDYTETVAGVATGTPAEDFAGFTSLEAEWIRLGEELQYGNIGVDEFVDQLFAHINTL